MKYNWKLILCRYFTYGKEQKRYKSQANWASFWDIRVNRKEYKIDQIQCKKAMLRE